MSKLRLPVFIGMIALAATGCGISQTSGTGPNAPTISGQTAVPVIPTATLETVQQEPTEAADAASPTLPPAGQEMLGAFPMSLGASWTYNVVLDYDSQTGLQHFEGEVTETVVEATPHLEAWVFRTQITGHPMMPRLEESGYYYTLIGSGMYRFEWMDQAGAVAATNPQETPNHAASQILAWPLEIGMMMGDPAFMNAEGRNVWIVDGDNVAVDVPAGHFEGCFTISKLTNPDDSHRWFCPGTGVVMYEYRHHGSRFDESWTLISFTPGS